MRLEEAMHRLNAFVNRPFRDIFNESDRDLVVDKGRVGKALEIILGLQNTPNPLDFEDGELKTNKCDSNGNPEETIFICQINRMIDELILGKPFEETHLCEKIVNILYVPVCKEGDPGDWMFLPSIHVDLHTQRFCALYEILKNDYESICGQLKQHIEKSPDGFIHTSNGQLIQVRSKDLKPYHPIYSRIYGRNVSNKNHAFYFKKAFVSAIRNCMNAGS